MTSRRNILVPLQVPWMVSPSVSDIHTHIIETGNTLVSFDVSILSQSGSYLDELETRRVEVRFRSGQWFRSSPIIDDSEGIPVGLFDRSEIRYPEHHASDEVSRWMEKRKQWHETGFSPNPSIYEVYLSNWIEQNHALGFGLKHYVIEGHDLWLEVLAKDFSWEWIEYDKLNALSTNDLK